MKFNTYFLDKFRLSIVFPVIIIDDEDLYSAGDMERLKYLLLRCRPPHDRFIKFIDATGYEFLFEPPVMALIPNVLRQQSFPWKKKELYQLYREAPNKPCDIEDPEKMLKKPMGDIIIRLAGLLKNNGPSVAGRLARPFRKRRPFDPYPWLH